MMGESSSQSCWRAGSLSHAPIRPSWLQATLTELEEKMQSLSLNSNEDGDADSFADRAENYYRKRPELLTLVNDLYRRYFSLADRYCLLKHQSTIAAVHFPDDDDDDCQINSYSHSDSDAESSLSYQPPHVENNADDGRKNQQESDTQRGLIAKKSWPESEILERLVGELVAKTVDYELLLHELDLVQQCQDESFRKIDLQKSLLEVLESERLILLSENGRLGFRVTTLAEENKSLVSEIVFLKRKANDLARCVLKMREDHRVCFLSRKVEDLQGKIYGLEKNNRDYYQQLMKRDEEKREAVREMCFAMEKVRAENIRLHDLLKVGNKSRQGSHTSRWWERAKKFKVLFCGFVSSPESCA